MSGPVKPWHYALGGLFVLGVVLALWRGASHTKPPLPQAPRGAAASDELAPDARHAMEMVQRAAGRRQERRVAP